MKIAISTDHAGFEMLRQLEAFLVSQGHKCVDFGPQSYVPGDDYPDFIFPAARAVARGECEMGIILGGSGQGEAIAANRVTGVRCAVFYGSSNESGMTGLDNISPNDTYEIVRLSREHNDANMLSLGARFLTLDQAKQAVNAWLHTQFSKDERHIRRIAKLDSAIQNDNTEIISNSNMGRPEAQLQTNDKHAQPTDSQSMTSQSKNAAISNDGVLTVRHED